VNHPFPKLPFKFFGPFRILEKIRLTAYNLELPAASQIHNVFHVSQLKPFTPSYAPVYDVLPVVPDLSTPDLEQEAVLDRWLVKKGNRAIPQVLVKWTNMPSSAGLGKIFMW